MAKQTKNKVLPQVQSIVQDIDMKVDEKWALEFLRRIYITRTLFIDGVKIKKYRDIDKGILDAESLAELKNYFDPKNRETGEGGTAEFMRTDWKPCPAVQSLVNIIKKQIKSGISSLSVRGTDKISVDKKAKEKLRILNKRNMVDTINDILALTNHPPISYDANLDKLLIPSENGEEEAPNLLAQIKAESQDDWDYALLSESGMLKDGVEIAHEEMISHYRDDVEFDDIVSERIISDYMHVNALCYRFYTSAMNGLPEVTYIDPVNIYTSNFKQKNGGDLDYWSYEFVTTWVNYMKMVGGKMDDERNKMVYEKNRLTWGNSDWPNFDDNVIQPTFGFLNTNIRLGYMEIKKHEKDENTGNYYNVIKKFYYLPLSSQSLDEKYILDLGNLQDMYRNGTNLVDAKTSLIVRRDGTRMSFYDIMNVDFSRMNKIYNQYLNTFASFIPQGVIFAEEPLRALADEIISEMQNNDIDIDQNAAQNIQAKIIRRVKQSGSYIAKKRKGENDEERLDNPTSIMENRILNDCVGLVQQLMTIYNMCLMSLGINPNRLAQEPKPRTTNKSIQGATASSQFATMDIEEAYEFANTEFGERMLYYNQQVISEFDKNLKPTSDRAKEMYAILGTKGINWLEVYRDMPEQRCILDVESVPTEQDRIAFMNYVMQLELQQKIPIGTLVIIQGIDNFKLANLFVTASIKRQQRIAIENQQSLMQQQQQAQQQSQQQQAQFNEQMQQKQTQTQTQLLALQEQLKTEGKKAVQDNSSENKKSQADHLAQLEMAKKEKEALI